MNEKQLSLSDIAMCFLILINMIKDTDARSKDLSKELDNYTGPTDYDDPEAEEFVDNQLLSEDYMNRIEVSNDLILQLQKIKSSLEGTYHPFTQKEIGDIIDLIDSRFGLDQSFELSDVVKAINDFQKEKEEKKQERIKKSKKKRNIKKAEKLMKSSKRKTIET